MKIAVLDKDDNNPKFERKNITLGVRVNSPLYTQLTKVIYQLIKISVQLFVYFLFYLIKVFILIVPDNLLYYIYISVRKISKV